MGVKESNEITVRIKGSLESLYEQLKEKGFKKVEEFSLNDIFFIPADLEIEKLTPRQILSKALLVREIKDKEKISKKITFKNKNFEEIPGATLTVTDEEGNIVSQSSINCDILSIEDAKKLLEAIKYKEIMKINENDIVYEKDGFEIAIKDIENGDNLIEIETEDNEEMDSVEKLKNKLEQIDIPIYKDDYFIKKAEIELEKVLKN